MITLQRLLLSCVVVVAFATPAASQQTSQFIGTFPTFFPLDLTFGGDLDVQNNHILFDNQAGTETLPIMAWADGAGNYDTGWFQALLNSVSLSTAGAERIRFGANTILRSTVGFGWDASGSPDALETSLYRGGTHILDLRDGDGDANTFRIFEDYDDSSNHHGLSLDAGVTMSDTATITPFTLGGGSANISLTLASIGATGDVIFNSSDDFVFQRAGFTAMQYVPAGGATTAIKNRFLLGTMSRTTDQTAVEFGGTFSPASGTATDRFLTLLPIMNWGGTPGAGNYEVFFMNVTETAIPTGTNYLIRAQVDSGDVFRVEANGAVHLGNKAEGGTAAISQYTVRDSVTLTGATTDTMTISIPSGAKPLGCSLNVDTTVVNDGDDTWAAAFATGSTTTIAPAGTAAAQNTKVNLLFADERTTDVTQIRFTPQGADFTAGVIEVVCYYEALTALADA